MMTEDPSPTPELKPEGAGDSFVPKDVLFLPAEETGVAHESVKALKEETSRKPARKRKPARRKAAGLAPVEGGTHNPREGLLNVALALFAATGSDAHMGRAPSRHRVCQMGEAASDNQSMTTQKH